MITVGKNAIVSNYLDYRPFIGRVVEYPLISPFSGEIRDWVLIEHIETGESMPMPVSNCSPALPIEFRMDMLARVAFCKNQIRNVWSRRHESDDTRASIRYRILCIREYRNREVCHA